MIAGISIYEIFTLTSILFFRGIYGVITRKNLISILITIERSSNKLCNHQQIFVSGCVAGRFLFDFYYCRGCRRNCACRCNHN